MENNNNKNSGRLSGNFIAELCKACLTNSKVLETCSKYLKYNYLETNAQKEVFRYILESHSVGAVIPTIGVIAQNFGGDREIISFLEQVKKIQVNKDECDLILEQLEKFIKNSRFVEVYNNTYSMFQEGKKEQAVSYMASESTKINEFTIKDEYFSTVFGDYQKRQNQRVREAALNSSSIDIRTNKIPSGIRELDETILGGFRRKTSVLILGQSGQGKTTCLRWFGISAARTGNRVVHFQIEGSESECLTGYDAAWTGTNLRKYDDLEITGEFEQDEQLLKAIEKTRKSIVDELRGEIYVYAAESFDSLTIERCREILKEIVASSGPVDEVIFDYLEVMETSSYKGSHTDERRRREKLANLITNIAIEFNCVTITATQASDINPKDLTNEQFVMTRHHISEFKGCLKPFSYFMTLNATPEEYKRDIMRIYCDKFRKHKAGRTITIAQQKDAGRFYESGRTLENFYVDQEGRKAKR